MQKTNEVLDFHSYFVDKEASKKLKAVADIVALNAKIDVLDAKVDSNHELLNNKIDNLDVKLSTKIDGLAATVQSEIKRLDGKIDSLAATTSTEFKHLDEKIGSLSTVMQADNKRLGDKIDNLAMSVQWLSTLVKWLVGIFVTIILAVTALVGTDIASLLGR